MSKDTFTIKEAYDAALGVRDHGDEVEIKCRGTSGVYIDTFGFLKFKENDVYVLVDEIAVDGWTIENKPKVNIAKNASVCFCENCSKLYKRSEIKTVDLDNGLQVDICMKCGGKLDEFSIELLMNKVLDYTNSMAEYDTKDESELNHVISEVKAYLEFTTLKEGS